MATKMEEMLSEAIAEDENETNDVTSPTDATSPSDNEAPTDVRPELTPAPNTDDVKSDVAQADNIKKANNGIIQVFTPPGFEANETDEDLDELARSSVGAKICPRVYRLLAFIGHAAFTMTLMTYTPPNFHVTKVISLGLAGMFVVYFIHIYWLIGYSKTAHRIYSLSGIVPNWTSMPITYRQLVYQYRPINSISEYSAIGGGIANQMLVVISSCSWMTIVTQTLSNIWFEKIWLSFTDDLLCDGCDQRTVNLFRGPNGIDAIILFVGAFGLVMIGIFELDPFSPTLQNGHMTGVFLGFGCPIAFSLQQIFAITSRFQICRDSTNSSAKFVDHKFAISFAIIADVVAVTFAIIWTFYYNKKSDKLANELEKNPPQTDEEKAVAQKKVRELTIKNVVSESITLLAGSLTMCLWLWNYDSLNPSFNEQPGVLPWGGPWYNYFIFLQSKYSCGDPCSGVFNVKSPPPTAAAILETCTLPPTMAPIMG